MNDENSRTGSQGKPGEGPVRDAGDYSLRLFDDFPNPIWRSGQDAKCNYFNREWLAFTGRTLEQELGFGWTEGVHPEDRDRCLKTLRDAFDRRAPFETEYRLRYHDGTYRWLLDCGKPYHNPDGTFAGYLGSCYDIHARREAEIALLESEKRYRDMFEINNAVMFIVDPESRQIVDANAAVCRFYGYSRDEMQHLLITQINIQDPQKTTKDMGVAAASPGSVFQFRHKKKNGEIRDVEVFSGTVYFGGRKLLHSIIQDVTDRTRGEEALKESETQYRDLVENVSEVIVSLDHEGKFTYVSPVAQRLYGYAPQELIGKNFLQFVHPDDRDRVTDVFRKELSGIYLADEFRVLAQDHSIHWISVAPRPIERDGNVVGFNYVMTDFTGRKIAEEALRESEQKFREIFSNINDGVEIHELQSDGLPGKYVEANEVSCRMLGYTREELLKMGPFDVAIDYQTPPITEIARQFLTQGRSRFETGHRNRQGTVIPVEINAHVISLGGRKLVLSVVRDITARKKAENEEQLTRERFETLVKIARIEDADEQEISEYILQAARHMTGSTLAFIGRMTPDESVMEIEFWSSSVMKECSVPSSFFHLPVQKAGLWADAVRTRQPKIVNDYAPSPGGKGLPSGHVNITRFLSLPILDNGKVVMVAAVANKPEPYDDADATRLALLMQGVWGHLQQRRADEALRESEEKFRLFFNNVNDAVYVHQIDPDGKPGRLVEVNDILCHNLGYTREELLSLSIPDILSEAGLRRIQETSGVIDHAGQAIFETEHRRKDGSIVPVEVSTHRFTQGKILLALANARDITERKKAEEALLASEQKFHDIFNNSTDAIHINEIGEDGLPGRFSDVNEVTCRMLGYTREEILALGPQDIATSYHDPPVEKILEDQRTKGAARFETEYRTRNGGIIPVEIITHRMILQGRPVMLEVVRDITDRKKAEALLRDFNCELEEQVKAQTEKINASLNEKVLLLREIHHRVKNNLQLIISLTNLQMRESSNPQLIQMMKETQNRVRAMSLVHERLYQSDDIARINLADYTRFLATQIFGFYGTSARQVKLTLDVDRIMLDINTAIPTGLILNELVSNALKHAFPDNLVGEVSITAREEGNAFVLQVRDTGIGMPAGFDWKESQTLGLRLVWILTEQLNGTAELLPAEKGTAFSLRLTKAKGTDSTGM